VLYLSLNLPTVSFEEAKFLSYGIEAYLLSELVLFSAKTRKRIKSDRKLYIVDNGFFNAKNIGVSENYGKLLENLVFCELRSRGYRANQTLFYYETASKFEVDFLLRTGHEHQELIQVAYSLGSLKTRERECRALAQAAEELKLDKLTILTLNEESVASYEGKIFEIKPIHRWLVET